MWQLLQVPLTTEVRDFSKLCQTFSLEFMQKAAASVDVCHVLTSPFIHRRCRLFNDWDKILLSGHNAVTLLATCSMSGACDYLLIRKLLDLSMPLHLMFVWTVMLQPCACGDVTAMLGALKNRPASSLQLCSLCL